MALKDIANSLTTTKNELHYRHISMQMEGMDEQRKKDFMI